jgi:hypothetical protein
LSLARRGEFSNRAGLKATVFFPVFGYDSSHAT